MLATPTRRSDRYAALTMAVLLFNVVFNDALVSFVVQRQVVFARPGNVEVALRSPVEQPAAAGQAIRRSASS